MTKKCSTLFCVLFAVISIAMAQPATMTKGQVDNSTQVDNNSICRETRDSLYVEILATYDLNASIPEFYSFPNDSSLFCPLGWLHFVTNYYQNTNHTNWHTWETSLKPDDYVIMSAHNYIFIGLLDSSCYIKVTVTDEYGNTGSDSIYFNIKNWVIPPDNFEMEIVNANGNLNAKLSFTANNDVLFFQKWISQNNTHHDPNYIPDDEGWYFIGGEQLYPGNYTEDIIYNYNYNENTVWNILTQMFDTCINAPYDVLPGMYLCTKDENNGHYLNMKTSLQPEDDEYVYTIFTVDSNGIRYPFIVNGGQVILPSSTTSYQIPAAHEHPYYQCAVAKLTDSGEYKILSYSNKVDNPWIDTTDIGEYDKSDFQVYPNPAKDRITVEGTGNLSITNALGQTILTQVIDGQTTIELPQGLYFARMGNVVRKIVVE